MQDPIQTERDNHHISSIALLVDYLARIMRGATAQFSPPMIEMALIIVTARAVRQAYRGATRAELAEHVRVGVLQSLESLDDDAPEEVGLRSAGKPIA